jgi:hypothetical protein
MRHSYRLPQQGAFFVRQRDKFIDERICCQVISALNVGKRRVRQRVHQRGGVTDLTRILERVLGVSERGLGVTKTKQSPRPMAQDCHPGILAKTHCQRTMLGRIIKRERLIIVGPAFRDVSRTR